LGIRFNSFPVWNGNRKRDIYSSHWEDRGLKYATLRSFIQETITRTYLTYTFDCDTPYDMLIALKQRVAPTNQTRKIELVNQYQKLKKAPRSQNLDTWLQQWEKTYKECKQLKLPDVEDDRLLYDFLNALPGIA
jgi:hypothetical protein